MGRKASQEKMLSVGLTLPRSLVELIDDLARRDERSRTAQIRYLLRLALGQEEGAEKEEDA